MNCDDSFKKSSDLSSGRRPKAKSGSFSKLSSPFMRYGHLNFLTFQKRCQVFWIFTPGAVTIGVDCTRPSIRGERGGAAARRSD